MSKGYLTVTPGLISLAEQSDQGQGDHVDNVDGDHGAYGAGGVDLRPLLNILGQCAAQSSVRDVHAGVPQDQNAVSNIHIYGFGRVGPGGMRPKGQYQHKGCQGRANEKPGAVAAPAALGAVTQRTDQRVIDGVPKPGDQHKGRDGGHRDAADVCIEDHQEIANKHETAENSV